MFTTLKDRSRTTSLSALVILLAAAGLSYAQQESTSKPKTTAQPTKAKGRLPAHFGRVVSDTQRQTIYRLQAEYAEKIASVKMQIGKLQEERDDAIDALLTPDQRRQVQRLRDEAKAAREARAASRKGDAERDKKADKKDAEESDGG